MDKFIGTQFSVINSTNIDNEKDCPKESSSFEALMKGAH